MPREPLERPRQGRGRGLVAGDQQRHQLVAQLLVGQRITRCLNEQGQDVLA